MYNFPSTFFNDFWEQWQAERLYQKIVEERVQMWVIHNNKALQDLVECVLFCIASVEFYNLFSHAGAFLITTICICTAAAHTNMNISSRALETCAGMTLTLRLTNQLHFKWSGHMGSQGLSIFSGKGRPGYIWNITLLRAWASTPLGHFLLWS